MDNCIYPHIIRTIPVFFTEPFHNRFINSNEETYMRLTQKLVSGLVVSAALVFSPYTG